MAIEIYVTTYAAMPELERACFARLVAEGGAVTEERVTLGIQRLGVQLIVAKERETMVGVAALKMPLPEYRDSIAIKSGETVEETAFPLELGYVSVAYGHSGRGVGLKLCDMVIRIAGDSGAFATTGTPQMLTSILPRFGFRWVGKTWKGDPNKKTKVRPDLHLMVRPSLSRREAAGVQTEKNLGIKS